MSILLEPIRNSPDGTTTISGQFWHSLKAAFGFRPHSSTSESGLWASSETESAGMPAQLACRRCSALAASWPSRESPGSTSGQLLARLLRLACRLRGLGVRRAFCRSASSRAAWAALACCSARRAFSAAIRASSAALAFSAATRARSASAALASSAAFFSAAMRASSAAFCAAFSAALAFSAAIRARSASAALASSAAFFSAVRRASWAALAAATAFCFSASRACAARASSSARAFSAATRASSAALA